LAQVSLWGALARWLTLTAVSLLLGFFFFRLLVWQPVFTAVSDLSADEVALDAAQVRRGLAIARLGLGLLGLGLLVVLVDQAIAFELFSGGNLGTWAGTQFGQMWMLRLGLTAVMVLIVQQLGKAPRPWLWYAGVAAGVGLALTSSLISHSAALLLDSTQATAVDLAHTLAAAIWVGGLVYLAVAVVQARQLDDETRTWLNLSLILNFSVLAAVAVGVLLFSGGYLAWQHVGSWTALVGTLYGRVLLAKLGLALLAFALAGANLLLIKPRLNRLYDAEVTGGAITAVLHRFRLLVTAEAVTALLLILAAGFLADIQRGVDAPLLGSEPGRTVVREVADGLTAELTVEPALVGWNSFDIALFDENGLPVTDATEIAYRFTFLGRSIGANEVDAERQENGTYRLEGNFISLIGGWQLEVAVRRPNAFDTFIPYRLEAGLGGEIVGGEQGAGSLQRAANFMTLLGSLGTGALIVLLAIGWGFVATRAAKREWQLVPLLLMSIFGFWLGAGQLFTFFTVEYTPSKFLTNPIVPDQNSITIGQGLFEQNCATCHGELGRGDGPAALSLNPPPVDFGSGHTATHPDGDLYYWIRNGIEGTPMPAFEAHLSSEETWHLVNYVRRLANQ
jgi:copper transport protein